MMKFCLNWGGAALLSMLLLCTSIVIPAFLFQSLRCARGEMKDSKEA